MLPPKRHTPPHLYFDNSIYFVTSRIYNQNFSINDGRKRELLDKIRSEFNKHHYQLFAYVILDNHYHLLMQTSKGIYLPKIFQNIHGSLSRKWNLEDKVRKRKLFHNYFDTCIRDEKRFFLHLNYIHNNPIKHKYSKNIADYHYSSYHFFVKEHGKDWINDCFRLFPIIDFSVDE